MKSTALCLSFFTLTAHAHYNWPWIYVNGTMSTIWQYVRDVAGGIEPGEDYGSGYDKTIPEYDVTSTNFTCGRLAFDSANRTQTADVVAGTVVSFRVNQGAEVDDPGNQYFGVNHPGPAQAYLAKAPDGVALEEFSGIDGDWFKIASLGATSNTTWYIESYDTRVENITIPVKTPPGKYLLRFEQFWRNDEKNWTQFFINCAQINIMGSGSGNLAGYPFAKFPGAYDMKDPGNLAVDNMKGQYKYPREGLLNWVAPGPPVWTG